MTPQEIFNQVATHLLTQKEKAMHDSDENMCAYRAEDGLKCAFGGVLPDKMYDPMMEGTRADGVFDGWPKVAEYFGEGNRQLVQELQNVHDDNQPDEWRECLQDVATDYDLDSSILDTL